MSAPSSQAITSTLLTKFSLLSLALMCLIPFLSPHHLPPIATFYNEWLAALFGLTAAIIFLRKSSFGFVFPLIAVIPLGLIIILGLQIVLGKALYWQNHYLIMLYLGLATLMMVLGANLRAQLNLTNIVPILAWAIIIGGIASISIVVLAKLGLAEVAPWSFFIRDYSASHVGQINHLANYLALGLASVVYLFLSQRLKYLAAAILTIVFFLALSYTGQRMAVLYVLVLSILGYWLARKCAEENVQSHAKQLLWIIPVFILAELVLPLLTFLDASSTPSDRVLATMNGESVRLTYLQQAWQLFLSHPWFGAGWSELGWYNFSVTNDFPDQTGLTSHAHNIVFQLLAETGVFGAGLLVVATVYWLYKQNQSPMTAERWWLLALLAVLGIHSLLEYPLWYAYFLVIAALLLGLGEQVVFKNNLQLMPVLFAGVLIFGAWSMGNLLQHYHQLENTLMAFKMNQVQDAEINPILDELSHMRQSSPLTPQVDNVIIRILPNHPQLLADKLAINEKVVHFWPGKSETYTHAALLAMNNQPEQAKQMMQMAIKQFPSYPSRYLPLLTGEMMKGRTAVIPLVFMLQEADKSKSKNKK